MREKDSQEIIEKQNLIVISIVSILRQVKDLTASIAEVSPFHTGPTCLG